MNIHSIRQQLLNLFRKSKKDRHRFLANNLSANIAAQIFSLRTAEERKWTQAQLAHEAGIAQPRIPVYESPDYGAFSLKTLKKFAYAFDLALIVKFVSFDQLASEIANQSSENLAIPRFEETPIAQQTQALSQNFNAREPNKGGTTSEFSKHEQRIPRELYAGHASERVPKPPANEALRASDAKDRESDFAYSSKEDSAIRQMMPDNPSHRSSIKGALVGCL